MNTVIVWVAQYLLWVMVAGFAAVWLFAENRRGKIDLAAQAVVGIVLMVIFLYIAKSVHHDPRPFVENPHIKPLFGHSRDNGFPSDHSLAAGLIAVLVLLRHRLLGLPFVAAAIAIAWARVAAHVHHLQDVVAGLLLGGLAAVLAFVIVNAVLARWRSRRAGVSSRAARTSTR
ncbi:MAG TPA: phosphatase PAP2 family protein [Jatrophihabitans sp.]|nr:phosphatase PAP2 family protein [Jatrophihabitans sp.]